MWFEFSAGVTEEIEKAEEGNIPIRFYNFGTGCYQGIHSCEGDMMVICNSLADYADILMEFIRQSDYDGYQKAFYEIHTERCRKIGKKLEAQIGYDRDAAIERCRAKKKYWGQRGEENQSDVGEDALVLSVKRAREQKAAQEKEKGEQNE